MTNELFRAIEREEGPSSRVTAALEALLIEIRHRLGDPLPSGRELAPRSGVSGIVVREAMRVAAAQGPLSVRPDDKGAVRESPTAPGPAPLVDGINRSSAGRGETRWSGTMEPPFRRAGRTRRRCNAGKGVSGRRATTRTGNQRFGPGSVRR